MPKSKLHVELLRHSAAPEEVVALAAKLCYSDSDIDGLSAKISDAEQTGFIGQLIGMGHFSVFEHISFTFGVEGVSRAMTHQLVRHRVASYSQKSQRYVKHSSKDFQYIIPPSIEGNNEAENEFLAAMDNLSKIYDNLIALGIPPEDARYLLPNAAESKIIITMNARELLHFFELRSCNRAQWEIRDLSDKMLELCYNVAPAVFKMAGPGCINKGCPEGRFTCGKAGDVRKRISALKSTRTAES